MYIPKSVTSIGSALLHYAAKLESVVVEDGNPVYDSRNNCNAIIEASINKLKFGCQNTIVPNGIKIIGVYAFYGMSNLQEINLPESLTVFDTACLQQTGLTSIKLPSKLTTIGQEAFYLSNISEFYIPALVSSIGNRALCTKHISSIVIDSKNTYYDSRNNCNAVIETASNTLIEGSNNTIIPNTVISIGYRAFNYCSDLISLNIPISVTSIADQIFMGCLSLTSLTVDKNNPKFDSRNNCNAVIETDNNKFTVGIATSTIPEGVKIIGSGAFYGVTELTSIVLPSTLETIETNAFYQTSLRSITIPSRVREVQNSIVAYCNQLANIMVDAGNTVYDSRDNCNAIIETATNTLVVGCKTSTIPNTITAIGDYAFYVSAITNITIPDSVKTIGRCSFTFSHLETVTIPDSVTSLGYYAFSSSNYLTTVVIGNGVTIIGAYAFNACYKLNSITFRNSNNWKVYSNTTYADGINAGVSSSDTFYNSTLFKSIYVNKWWKRG